MAQTVRSIDSKRSSARAATNGDAAGPHAYLEEWRDEVAEVDRQLRTAARERPFLVVGLALAGGYLLGRVLAGR